MFSAAAERNKTCILDVLLKWLPKKGTILEVASGSGQHAKYFSTALSQVSWQPSEKDKTAVSHLNETLPFDEVSNLLPAKIFDVLAGAPFAAASFTGLVCINLIHISGLAVTEALFRQAVDLLQPKSPVILYGPYYFKGQQPAESNVAFDKWLRAQDPSYGIRAYEVIEKIAGSFKFQPIFVQSLPANNFAIGFEKGF